MGKARSVKAILREIKGQTDCPLRKAVINDVLQQEDTATYMSEVLKYGCKSGMVSGLIYYNDTEKFFKKFYVEILEIAENIRQEYGEISFSLDSNTLAWLGYEETIRSLSDEVEEMVEIELEMEGEKDE